MSLNTQTLRLSIIASACHNAAETIDWQLSVQLMGADWGGQSWNQGAVCVAREGRGERGIEIDKVCHGPLSFAPPQRDRLVRGERVRETQRQRIKKSDKKPTCFCVTADSYCRRCEGMLTDDTCTWLKSMA